VELTLGDTREHSLTWNRVPDEDDASLMSGHAVTPMRHGADDKLVLLPYQ